MSERSTIGPAFVVPTSPATDEAGSSTQAGEKR